MLVLSREHGQYVEFTNAAGEVIRIHTYIRKGRIRLGIDAPSTITILRGEACVRTRISNPNHSQIDQTR